MHQLTVSRTSVRILRIFLSGIFLVAGANHLLNVDQTVARMHQASLKNFALYFGEPGWLVILSGIVMLTAGLALLAGFLTRWAALVLLLVLIPITITVQLGQMTTLGPLFKNVAIAGGLLFFILNTFTPSNQPDETLPSRNSTPQPDHLV
ncbi:putative oxidoreductase [Lewinella aquimaris]|uniref:Putative oxidoreductase n=1 Tax=Neolewinella aquimaris TaxID=1835722 RepID=A0A840E7G2_9BACT|nr:DoxX family protein [Neolewinella aquimaris]MBB4079187.1 putative oxidoreductase [Neolewinella aquimaris]